MTDSILNTTKKLLGLAATDESFDTDVITYINTTFADLHDLGIGPAGGFMIEDASATWADFLGSDEVLFNDVKTFITLTVRLLFDPPHTSFGISAIEKQIEKRAWMINVRREGVLHPIDVAAPVDTEETVVVSSTGEALLSNVTVHIK